MVETLFLFILTAFVTHRPIPEKTTKPDVDLTTVTTNITTAFAITKHLKNPEEVLKQFLLVITRNWIKKKSKGSIRRGECFYFH